MAEINWNLDAERELWRAICSPRRWFDPGNDQRGDHSPPVPVTHPDSLWWFVHLAYGAEWYFRGGYSASRDVKRRWLTRRIHGPYLQWLQTHRLDWMASRRAGINKRWMVATVIPRAFGKTVTATKCAPLWCHLDDADMSTLFLSATEGLSVDILKSVHEVVSNDGRLKSWFAWLYGNWKNPEREWTKRFSHHGFRRTTSLSEPSFDTSSAETGATGYHHDDHEWDDPIIKNKLHDGGVYMENTHAAFNTSYPALAQDGWLGMTLTPYLDDDIRGRHFKEEGVASWSGMPPPDERLFERISLGKGLWHVYFLQMEDELTGVPTAPEIISEGEIYRWKTLDPEDFACQGQCNPGTGGTTPLLESQVRDCFVDYESLRNEIPIDRASVHLDTAFKSKKNVGKGDFSVIVPYLHDARPIGIVYLHTDLLRESKSWRAEEFDDELIQVFHALRRQQYRVSHLTDEVEPGGKEGMYKSHLLATLKGAGFGQMMPRIVQFNRQGTRKDDRIRKAAGFWAAGYVRILLHKDKNGQWILPVIVRRMINQMVRVDVVDHNDLADAGSDVFMPPVWRLPHFDSSVGARDEGFPFLTSINSDLMAMSRPLSNEEVKAMQDGQDYAETLGPGHGPDVDWLPSRDPI